MTATYEPAQAADTAEWQRQLDQLVPPPMGPWRKLLAGSTLVSLAIGFAVIVIGGYLYPNPFFGSSFSSGTTFEVDQARGVVGVRVFLPNFSSRTLRVTAADLEAEGIEVVEVALTNDHSGPSEPLPALIEPDSNHYLLFWVKPTQCTDPPAPWGIAKATVDFGEGAFPSVARTIRITQDPVWEGEEVTFIDSAEPLSGKGPLSAACEALK